MEFGMNQDSDAVASREPFVELKQALGPHLATDTFDIKSNSEPVELNSKAVEALARAKRTKERLENEARIAQQTGQASSASDRPKTARAKKKTQKQRPCWFWKDGKGNCKHGAECKYLHAGAPAVPPPTPSQARGSREDFQWEDTTLLTHAETVKPTVIVS